MHPVCMASGGVSESTTARPDKSFRAKLKQGCDTALDRREIEVLLETKPASPAFLERMAPIPINYEGVDTLFLTRLMSVEPSEASSDWIAMEVNPNSRRDCKLSPTDVCFLSA